jgi:hypothetical protein
MLSSKKQKRKTQTEDGQELKYGLKEYSLKELAQESTRENTVSRAERVSVRAYHLWTSAGKLKGRDMEFWLQAEREENAK